MWFLKLLALLAAAYVILLAAGYFMQDRLLFPTRLAESAGLPLPEGARRLTVETPDGARLAGARIPASRPGSGDGPVILGFGGNGWNADALAVLLHQLYPGADIVVFHYRGYAPSTGSPGGAALRADAVRIHDALDLDGGERPVIAVGLSIGAGVATHLAAERDLDGLVLVTPFDSLKALAREHFPWAPAGLLLRHEMPAVRDMREIRTPTAVIAAERDEIVPSRRTAALRPAIRNLVYDRTIPGAGHNDLYAHPAFAEAMTGALERILARRD